MAKPAGIHSNANNGNGNGGGGRQNANGGAATYNGANSVGGNPKTALRHNPGLSLDWTSEEQSILEDLQNRHASEINIIRYAKIAEALKDKTVRDVALRCRWMNKKENGKRRKDDRPSRKNKDKKEKVTDSLPRSSQLANRSNGTPYAQPMMSMDSDDGISYEAIGGRAGEMLKQNAEALEQISANFSSSFKIQDNIHLFRHAMNNIKTILAEFKDMPEIMKSMPALPVQLDEERAVSVLSLPPLTPSRY